jgi:biopolymer transport protein ExbD
MSNAREAPVGSGVGRVPGRKESAILLAAFLAAGASTMRQERADLTLPVASEIGAAAKDENQDATTRVDVRHRRESAEFSCPLGAGADPCRENEHWKVVIRDAEYGLDAILAPLKTEAKESMETEVDPHVGVALSARRILIRADQVAPYGHVNKIIEICSRVGIYKVAVAARFEELEGKFECWLPRPSGVLEAGAAPETPSEIRVALLWNDLDRKTIRRLGNRVAGSDAELQLLIDGERDRVRSHQLEPAVTLDAAAHIPWKDVVNVINLCKRARIDEIEFALPAGR